MSSNQTRKEATPDSRQILLAILALMIDERESRVAGQSGVKRTELVLASGGLDSVAIAALLNKPVGTVRVAIHRAGKKGPKTHKESMRA